MLRESPDAGEPYNEYTYDDLDRLTDVTYHSAETEMFNMDNLGNRTSVVKRDTAVDTYALDSATNRYDLSAGGPYEVTCAYDAAGNTTRDKDNYAYWYDYENRVVKIEDSSSNDVAEYGRYERVRALACGARGCCGG
ncbi:MAG: hypothetical protein IH624_08475 [Phycisphaerae bacterium]|nr:hypothetical protein [Phycisphaerae bacterium]